MKHTLTLVTTLPQAADAPKPNVLLIARDDLGLKFSCYGHRHVHAPHLNAGSTLGARET